MCVCVVRQSDGEFFFVVTQLEARRGYHSKPGSFALSFEYFEILFFS